MPKPDPDLLAAMSACVAHARDLLESAVAVMAIGRSNIAYHLATLSLEELGRRQLIAIQSVRTNQNTERAWQSKATQDHVKKLFWCFYGGSKIDDMVDQANFFEMSDFATRIHANRLAGLYVDDSDQGLKIPARAISPEQAQMLINLANALLKIAENEKPREDMPQEETELQAWLLAAFDDPERRKYILTTTSFAKLKELQDVRAWTLWIKSEIERSEAELQAVAQREIQRGFEPPVTGGKDKWKIELRIETHSHSIRPAPLKSWNAAVHRIKLTPVQRGRVKNEILVELILGEEVPIQGVWGVGLSMANLFIIGVNMATSGFWWWVLPRHKTRYYEKIYDLEHKAIVQIDGANLNIFYDRRPALNDTNIQSLIQCLSALPGPDEQDRAPAYHFYLGGLTFLSINDIHWRCEAQAFGNFLQSLKLLMIEARFPHHSDEPWDQVIGRFLKEKYSDLEPTEHEAFVRLVGVFEGHVHEPVAVKPVDVYLMKLLCETFFRDTIVPAVLAEKSKTRPA